jgi:uncharacterized membrane protein SpoIIM required for sporulation
MTQHNFVSRRQNFWNDIELTIIGSKKNFKEHAALFPEQFQELTQDLNTARANGFDPDLIERLNRLVLEGNHILYGQHSFSLKHIIDFVMRIFPQAIRANWKGIFLCHLIFYGLAFFMIMLCTRFPEFTHKIIPWQQLDSIEEMYDPSSEHFLTPRDVSNDADMFGYYIFNNVSIAFRSFAGGILAGIGSLFVLIFNAAFFGVIAAHIINSGFSQTFFSFVIGHGSFELTAIIISAYAGLVLGYRIFVTKGLSRTASIKQAGKNAIPLITGSTVMLIIAAVIEAFWSSRNVFSFNVHFIIGTLGWIFVYAYFIFSGRKNSRGSYD